MTSKRTRRPAASAPAPGEPARRSMRRWALLPALLAMALYLNTLGHGYVLDDPLITLRHAHVQAGLAGLRAIFTTNFLNGVGGFNDGLYRPLVLASFALEHALFGTRPFLSHLANVLLYAGTGTLLFVVLRRLFPGRHPVLPLAMSLLFIAHPVHTEVVANLKGRDELLAFLNSLGALFFFLRYQKAGRAADLGLGLTLSALAVLSKESAVTLLLAVPWVLWFTGSAPRGRRVSILVGLTLVIALLVTWRHHVVTSMPTPMDPGIVAPMNNSVLATNQPIERFATALGLQLRYLGKLLIPYPLAHDYSYNQIPVVGLLAPIVLGAAAAVAGMLVVVVLGFRRRDPVALGIGFYLVTLFATSNLVVPIGATFAERFLYTPSLGFAIVLGALLGRRIPTAKAGLESPGMLLRQHRVAMAVLALALTAYSAGTVIRNRDWHSNLDLFRADIGHVGRSARAQYNLGTALYNQGFETADPARQAELIQDALGHLRRAVSIYPEYPDALHNLAQALILAGQPDSAAVRFREAIARDSTYAPAYLGLGLLEASSAPAEAVRALERYLTLRPQAANGWQALGRSYANLGRPGSAIIALERALSLTPGDLGTMKDLGTVLGMAGRLEDSLNILLRAAAQDPADRTLLGNIAVTYRRLGNVAKAEEYEQRARGGGP